MAARILAHLPNSAISSVSDSANRSHYPRGASVLEFCSRDREISAGAKDGLGCFRGIAAALGIQALVLILALIAWKMY